MKTKLFLTIITFGTLITLHQQALGYFLCTENWYVAGSPTINWHTVHKFSHSKIDPRDSNRRDRRTYKWGGGFNVSFGYILHPYTFWNLRLEEEILYRRNALSRFGNRSLSAVGETRDIALMTNLISDIPLNPICPWIAFYFGGGIGISFNELLITSIQMVPLKGHKIREEYFAYQLMSGFSFNISPGIDLTAGYRLFATAKVRTRKGGKSKDIPLTQSIDLGMRFIL